MQHGATRRELISGTAAGVALLAEETAEAGGAPITIIDTHQHLWDFRLFRPPWLSSEPRLNKSTTMAEYLKATAGLNVRKTVYMEVDLAPEQQLKEAEWVEEVCAGRKTPMSAAVVSGRPGKPGFEQYVQRLQRSPHIRGLRQVLHGSDTPPGYCLRPEFVHDVQMLGQLGMTFDICIRPEELADAGRLADACPEVRFILDHCGNATARDPNAGQWKRDISHLSRRPNIVCKISGVVRTVQPGWDPIEELRPIVAHCMESFGIGRVMFGGDWPVCNLGSSFAGWVACLKEIVSSLGTVDQRKLFDDNAAAYYRID